MSEQHSLFPITLATKWQAPEVYELDAGIIDWLLDPNSLTARLKQHCQRFEVLHPAEGRYCRPLWRR